MSDQDERLDAGDASSGEGPFSIPPELPILPLRDTVLFPNSFMPLAVARETSVRLIDDAIVGGKLVVRLGIDALLGYASALAAVSGLVMLGLAVAGVATVWAVVVPMSGFMGAFALIHPQVTAGALSPFPGMAGLASSVQGILQTLVGVLVSVVIGLLDDGTQMPMAAAVAVVGVGGLMSYKFLVRRLPPGKTGPSASRS